MKPKKVKPKKARKSTFAPKKVKSKHNGRKSTEKLFRGDRFGKRWFPHQKD